MLARTDGYVKKRFVDIGDSVKAGQLMALIEAPDLTRQVQQARATLEQSKSALNEAQAALEQATANAKLAGITAKRWATLQEHGAVSKQENDTYQTAYSSNLASVGIASANVAAARTMWRRIRQISNATWIYKASSRSGRRSQGWSRCATWMWEP